MKIKNVQNNNKNNLISIVSVIGLICAIYIYLRIIPSGPLAKIYWIGSAFCHQTPMRSPSLLGHIFPVCYRCAGFFLGIFISAIITSVLFRNRKIKRAYVFLFLGTSFLAYFIDIINANSLLQSVLRCKLYISTPITRFISAFFFGYAMFLTLYFLLNWVNNVSNPSGIARVCIHFIVTPIFALILWLCLNAQSLPMFYTLGGICLLTAVSFLIYLYKTLISLLFSTFFFPISSFASILLSVTFTATQIAATVWIRFLIGAVNISSFTFIQT